MVGWCGGISFRSKNRTKYIHRVCDREKGSARVYACVCVCVYCRKLTLKVTCGLLHTTRTLDPTATCVLLPSPGKGGNCPRALSITMGRLRSACFSHCAFAHTPTPHVGRGGFCCSLKGGNPNRFDRNRRGPSECLGGGGGGRKLEEKGGGGSRKGEGGSSVLTSRHQWREGLAQRRWRRHRPARRHRRTSRPGQGAEGGVRGCSRRACGSLPARGRRTARR